MCKAWLGSVITINFFLIGTFQIKVVSSTFIVNLNLVFINNYHRNTLQSLFRKCLCIILC